MTPALLVLIAAAPAGHGAAGSFAACAVTAESDDSRVEISCPGYQAHVERKGTLGATLELVRSSGVPIIEQVELTLAGKPWPALRVPFVVEGTRMMEVWVSVQKRPWGSGVLHCVGELTGCTQALESLGERLPSPNTQRVTPWFMRKGGGDSGEGEPTDVLGQCSVQRGPDTVLRDIRCAGLHVQVITKGSLQQVADVYRASGVTDVEFHLVGKKRRSALRTQFDDNGERKTEMWVRTDGTPWGDGLIHCVAVDEDRCLKLLEPLARKLPDVNARPELSPAMQRLQARIKTPPGCTRATQPPQERISCSGYELSWSDATDSPALSPERTVSPLAKRLNARRRTVKCRVLDHDRSCQLLFDARGVEGGMTLIAGDALVDGRRIEAICQAGGSALPVGCQQLLSTSEAIGP